MKYEVAIINGRTSRRLETVQHQGKRYVIVEESDLQDDYVIEVKNNTGLQIEASVSVDGLSVMNGEPASIGQEGYLVYSYGRYGIRGWRRGNDAVAAFTFESLTDSYASLTGRPKNVGVIGVSIFPEKYRRPLVKRGKDVYRTSSPYPNPNIKWMNAVDESSSSNKTVEIGAQSVDFCPFDEDYEREAPTSGGIVLPQPQSKKIGTGYGNELSDHVDTVSFKRDISANTVFVLHYDTRRNLIDRGILDNSPNPFPASEPFVPAPRNWRR